MENNNIEHTPHFRISAAVVKQLGEELITDEVTAFMELVKNSYDADSTKVTIDINTAENIDIEYLLTPPEISKETVKLHDTDLDADASKEFTVGYISVKDNGFGMSREDIIEKWMMISLSEKKDAAKKGIETRKGRTYLGEKGVGRLSTQRLGSIIDLITGKIGDDFYSHVYFDWNAFNEHIALDEVKPGFKRIPKKVSESGTEILIRNLRSKEIWDGESYSKILGQLSQLIFPKPNAPGGFKINIKKNNSIFDLVDINNLIAQSYVSTFSFTINEEKVHISGTITLKKLFGSSKENHQNYERFIVPDNGKDFVQFFANKQNNKKEFVANVKYEGKEGKLYSWSSEIKLTDLPELVYVEQRDANDNLVLNEEGMFIYELAHPGPFSGVINDYSFSRDFGQVLDNDANLNTIIQNQTGIRIYRNGFGIKPYGINSQDWLKLGAGNTRGGSFYGLKPFNVIGYIEIGAKENYQLKEKTDREGFVDSPYSINFFKIMDYIIKQINLTLEKTRRGFNEYIKSVSAANVGIDPIQETFDNLVATAINSRQVEKRLAAVNFRLAEASEKVKGIKFTDDIANDRQVLIDQKNQLSSLLVDSNAMLEEITSILNETKKLDSYVDILKPQIESLESQLSEFTDLASLGLTAEALSHELSNIADKLYEETNSVIKKYAKKIPNELVQINRYLESVKSSVASFRKQLSHLDPALKYVRESKETFYLADFFEELVNYYKSKFGNAIEVDLINDSQKVKVKANKGKLTQIVDNLVLNAEYWLKENAKKNRTFLPKLSIHVHMPYIRIFDNGSGVPTAIEETLFQPFVTLKPKGVGRGLGLFIVQQLLDSIGCSISLLEDRNKQGNRYIFQLYINSLSF